MFKRKVYDQLVSWKRESAGTSAMLVEGAQRVMRLSFERGAWLPDDLLRKALRLWREYMLVGGMPQMVEAYLPGRDMAAADRAKRLALKLYRGDID